MRVHVLAIGKLKEKALAGLEEEYLKRLSRAQFKVEVHELAAPKAKTGSEEYFLKEEARIFLAKVTPEDFVILLDEKGEELASKKFATLLEAHLSKGTRRICFLIGGAYGFHASMYERAQLKMSLSRLTFSYQLARLVLAEQLYRAWTLISGHPYHK